MNGKRQKAKNKQSEPVRFALQVENLRGSLEL